MYMGGPVERESETQKNGKAQEQRGREREEGEEEGRSLSGLQPLANANATKLEFGLGDDGV